jgi:hypothetical protein
MDSSNFTSLYSAGCQQKKWLHCDADGFPSAIFSSGSISSSAKPQSRTFLSATCRLMPLSTSHFVPGRFREQDARYVSLSPDRRLIASTYIFWWCVVFTRVSFVTHTPRTSQILLHDIHLRLDGIVFLSHHVPTSRAPHSDLARRMFDPDDLYVMAVRGMCLTNCSPCTSRSPRTKHDDA